MMIYLVRVISLKSYTKKTITIWLTSLLIYSTSLMAESTIIIDPNTYIGDKLTKIHPELQYEIRQLKSKKTLNNYLGLKSTNTENKFILVDAVAKGDPDILLADLMRLGLRFEGMNGRIISGLLPKKSLVNTDALLSLNEIRVSKIITQQGFVTSKGDRSQNSDVARQYYNVDGSGMTIGIISDSYDCLGGASQDKQSNDLPMQAMAIVDALDCTGKTDEGRALMQIIHDIAPGATLLFYSGSNGLANTANGILDFAFVHKTDIIVDDFKSLSANFFQKDAITQAVERVVRTGVIYVTAAGNSGRNSYQSTYRDYVNIIYQLNAHDFDPGPDIDIYQRITVIPGSGVLLLLQWDSPAYSISGAPGTQTDLDIFIFNDTHTEILASSTFGNVGRDPVEVLSFLNPIDSGQKNFDIMITKASGVSPNLLKYIILNGIDDVVQEFDTRSSALFGHANSESAITVGATSYLQAPAFGISPPLLEYYSSAGGIPLLFDVIGTKISKPTISNKPDIVAPDEVNTTFFGEDTDNDGMPNISGTSAAAPHAAGVIALLLAANSELQPLDIKQILHKTSIDIIQRNDDARSNTGVGFDFDSGYGLIDAKAAVKMSIEYQASTPSEPLVTDSDKLIVNEDSQLDGSGSLDMYSLLLILILIILKTYLRTEKTPNKYHCSGNIICNSIYFFQSMYASSKLCV